MDFATAQKEYKLLRTAYSTGAISLEELYQKVDSELEVTAEDGSVWKIDEDTGSWLFYDAQEQSWVERQPLGVPAETETNEEQLKVCLETTPELTEVPADVYRDWKNQTSGPGQAAKPATGDIAVSSAVTGASNICQGCGRSNKENVKFCTGCGKPLLQEPKCKNCGKALRPDNKFCTGCGLKS